jgi:hypothetical protein
MNASWRKNWSEHHILSSRLGSAWFFAFFPKGIASGILGVLIPLYFVQSLHGSLLDLGVMSSFAVITLIPASIYLGRVPDKYQRSKPFIGITSITGALLPGVCDQKHIVFRSLTPHELDELHSYSQQNIRLLSHTSEVWGKMVSIVLQLVWQATGLGHALFARMLCHSNLLSILYLIFISFWYRLRFTTLLYKSNASFTS